MRPSPSVDRLPPFDLLSVQWRAAGDVYIDLQLRRLVNQIADTTLGHCVLQSSFVDVEIGGECRHERRKILLVDLGDDIDVYGGARLTGERTGDRAADGMWNAQRLHLAHDDERHRNGIEGHTPLRASISG